MYTPIRWQQRFQNYEKAYLILKDALERTAKEPQDRLLQAGCLQAYEFTVELAWKTLKDYLEEKEVIALNPTDAIRHAFQQGYIQDAELWMEALKARNLTSHAYSERVADEILSQIRKHYFALLTSLYDFFKNKL
jgi:nucleotidyltransferase substrate binding protein (TIGR01987 family)